MSNLHFITDPAALLRAQSLHVIGRKNQLLRPDLIALLPAAAQAIWPRLTNNSIGDFGRAESSLLSGSPDRITVALLPEVCSRHNSPLRSWAWPRLLSTNRSPQAAILVAIEDEVLLPAVAVAIARSCPTFSARSGQRDSTVTVLILGPNGIVDPGNLKVRAEAVRQAAAWVDTPPDRLGPDIFVRHARAIGSLTGVSIHVLRSKQLHEQGLNGILSVGRAATQQPALVVLDWAPPDTTERVCWVGKGITYDCGGLSLKSRAALCGMKADMGGAAAVLAAFGAVVRLGLKVRLTAVLCVAENAIGPLALRPDDVVTMYSGRTVEINNTDAEGRLVLADGVAWAIRHRNPDRLIDIATLTGAQGTATGRLHGAIYCNDETLESTAVAIGRSTGDLVHPLPYAPELFRREFSSAIADMKNSVQDRNNAQASCAAQFIANHMGSWKNPWLHVDMAAVCRSGERGTGYGVGLLLGMLEE